MPLEACIRANAPGWVASCSMTTSAWVSRITAAMRSSRPRPPNRTLYERILRTLLLRLFEEHQIRLAQHAAPQMHDRVARRLNVHGASDHRHQLFAERCQCGRDVGIVVADRT